MNKALYNALSAKGVTQPLAHKAQWKIAAIVSVGKMSRLFSSLKLPSLTLDYNTEYSAAKYVQAIAFNIPQTFHSIINNKKTNYENQNHSPFPCPYNCGRSF